MDSKKRCFLYIERYLLIAAILSHMQFFCIPFHYTWGTCVYIMCMRACNLCTYTHPCICHTSMCNETAPRVEHFNDFYCTCHMIRYLVHTHTCFRSCCLPLFPFLSQHCRHMRKVIEGVSGHVFLVGRALKYCH